MNTPAVICLENWAGHREYPCRIIGERGRRYRIEVDAPTKLPGVVLKPGQSRLVPKSAVRVVETA
jgi:hypothetical protein